MIEGFCAAEEGKEYTPEGPSYEAKFPHIPEGVFGDTSDMITGCPYLNQYLIEKVSP